MRKETLEYLCEIKIGRTPPRKEEKYWGKGYKWVSISDMKDKVINSTKEEITAIAIKSINCRKIPKGTLLLSFKLSIGKRAFAGEDLYTNEAIAALIIKDTAILDNTYLYYALGAIELIGGNNAAMGTTLNSKSLAALKIPLPPLEDQKRIASILSRTEKLITRRKESIQLLDELLKSTFLEMFGPNAKEFSNWPLVEIKELAAKHKGSMRTGPFGSNLLHSEFTVEGDVAVLGIDNAVKNIFSWKERRYISFKKYEKLKNYQIFPGDVIITIMGTTGRSAVVPDDIPLAINTKHLAAITLDRKQANPYFLSYSIHSNPFIENQLIRRNRGAIMSGLNLGLIKEIKIHKVPIELQNDFASIIERVESIKSRYQQSLTELENLYGSLSQKAFKGELDLSRTPLPIDSESESKGAKNIQIQAFQGKVEPEVKTDNNTLKTIANIALAAGGIYLAKKLYDSLTKKDEQIEDFILTESYLNEIMPKKVLFKMFDDVSGSFYFQDFWEKTKESMISEMPENVSLATGWEDVLYPYIKSELFSLLEEQKLTQYFDEDTKAMALSVNR